MTDADIKVLFKGHAELQGRIGDTLLDIALRHGVPVDHACGGVCACSTCHVKVEQGADALSEAGDDEQDQLDTARDVGLTSRLGCQARIERRPRGGVIAAAIPSWNVNIVREGH
ncbi:MAG: 2Fe-2S iron-sulfur cluster binding domain-containing protein [Phycisphaerales bacterium]|nr:2Fe-2S iron-sulfur cluster binding domain-containing protein [Phycisphaerales bacterium]